MQTSAQCSRCGRFGGNVDGVSVVHNVGYVGVCAFGRTGCACSLIRVCYAGNSTYVCGVGGAHNVGSAVCVADVHNGVGVRIVSGGSRVHTLGHLAVLTL